MMKNGMFKVTKEGSHLPLSVGVENLLATSPFQKLPQGHYMLIAYEPIEERNFLIHKKRLGQDKDVYISHADRCIAIRDNVSYSTKDGEYYDKDPFRSMRSTPADHASSN